MKGVSPDVSSGRGIDGRVGGGVRASVCEGGGVTRLKAWPQW